jgi:CHASE3 domain sensor protein
MKEQFDLGEYLRKAQEYLQGIAIDLAKISPMSDRQLDEFKKQLKAAFRSKIDEVNDTIKLMLNDNSQEIIISDRPIYIKNTNNEEN